MTVSDISICSNALILLGGESISSFQDGTTAATISSHLYTTTYHAMLTETRWHFATRTAKLARHTEAPDNGWMYKFQLPVDCMYVVKCSDKRYEVYERDIFADHEDILIEYVYPVKEENLPMYFTKALEYNLAAQFAIPLTGNTSRGEFYASAYQTAVKKARWADASQRPNDAIEDSPYLTSRYSS